MTFQDVIMSTTGILLMFTFVLILSVGVNQYQKALEERQLEMEQMEQKAARFQEFQDEVDSRKELSASLKQAQTQVARYLQAEVTHMTKQVAELKANLQKLESQPSPAPELAVEFPRGSYVPKNPVYLLLQAHKITLVNAQGKPIRFVDRVYGHALKPEGINDRFDQIVNRLPSIINYNTDAVIALIAPDSFDAGFAYLPVIPAALRQHQTNSNSDKKIHFSYSLIEALPNH
jgi:uncharacterized protein YdcH (DUF465 family)